MSERDPEQSRLNTERYNPQRDKSRPFHNGGPESDGADQGAPPIGEPNERLRPNFRTLAEFIAEFRPISYAVAGLMREGSLYTVTGRTGEGKTAFLVILALAVATGRSELIGRKVKRGRVAFCTAENPDDLRMRLMVACFVFNIDPNIVERDILVSDNRVAPEDIVAWIRETGEAFTLILVDTWQAYFDGRDPNNNGEAVSFTRRFRPLAAAKGLPVVIVAAHPPKQAGNDNLLPYGGGGTLNEVDGNFTFGVDENGFYRLHWQGKIRGLSFDPLHFRIDKLDSPDVVTVEGDRVQMPVMFPIEEEAVDARAAALAGRDLALLKTIAADPTGSERKWALAVDGGRKAVRITLERLQRDRLVAQKAHRWLLTNAGVQLVNGADKQRQQKGPAGAQPGPLQ
jgi:hypothetical protein